MAKQAKQEKQARKTQKIVDKDFEAERGKRKHQQLKAYLVMEYLMQHTDEQHPATIDSIIGFLDNYGIDAERRSIGNDIKEINYVLYMLEENCSIDIAVEDLDSGDYDEEKFIRQTDNRRGFYVCRRRHDITETDARLLAETVYTARFLNKKKAERLVDIASSLVSTSQAYRIKHDIPEFDRPRTTAQDVYNGVSTINSAMNSKRPEKITFRYQKYSIDNIEKTVDKRNGSLYKVSPYKLILDNGNYYLLAFDDKSQSMCTYRVDRMKSIVLTGEPRDGEEEFAAEDLKNYTRRVFDMFRGKRVPMVLCFDNVLLDSVIDRLGKEDINYSSMDEQHFTVEVEIEVSDQFFAWLCGFGNMARIISPDSVVDEFKAFLDRIKAVY